MRESRLSVSREEMRSRIEGCTGKKSRERKKGGAAPLRPCGARERSFWSTEGIDYLDERLGRLSETVEVPHSSSVGLVFFTAGLRRSHLFHRFFAGRLKL